MSTRENSVLKHGGQNGYSFRDNSEKSVLIGHPFLVIGP